MTTEPTLVLLRADDLPWRSMTIPDSNLDVELTRLHLDPRTRANVALVRFPAGWARPGVGHYDCAEQFVVLDGGLEVSGVRFGEGEFGYLPARTVRAASGVAPGGCLAVAWFSGPPRWSVGPPASPPVEEVLHGRVGHPPGDVGGGACGLDGTPTGPVDSITELLWPELGGWCVLPAGALSPRLPGPVVLRRWQ